MQLYLINNIYYVKLNMLIIFKKTIFAFYTNLIAKYYGL